MFFVAQCTLEVQEKTMGELLEEAAAKTGPEKVDRQSPEYRRRTQALLYGGIIAGFIPIVVTLVVGAVVDQAVGSCNSDLALQLSAVAVGTQIMAALLLSRAVRRMQGTPERKVTFMITNLVLIVEIAVTMALIALVVNIGACY